jgi:hypothetical protein
MIIALAFVAGSVGASATQQDTLWSVRTGNNQVYDCHFTPSGDSVVAVAGDTLYILQTSTGSILKKSKITISVYSFRVFHHSPKMAIRGYNGDAFIWDYDADTLVCNLLPTLTTSSIAITPDDSLLIIGYHQSIGPNNEYKYKIYKYSVNQKMFIDSIDAYDDANAIDISPDGLSFAHSSKWTNGSIDYGQLILRNLNTWEIIKDFDPKYSSSTTQGLIKDIRFSPDGKYIGIAKWDGTVKVYRTDSLDLYRNFIVYGPSIDGGPTRISFSNNSQYIYAGLFVHDNYTTKLWNIENNELIFTYDCISVDGLDVSSHEYIISCGAVFINLLAPHWLSVSDPQQINNEQTSGFIISKSNNQVLTINRNCRNLGSCRLYDVFGNLIQYDNILSFSDNGNISINPAQFGTGVYFLAVGMERVVKVLVVE